MTVASNGDDSHKDVWNVLDFHIRHFEGAGRQDLERRLPGAAGVLDALTGMGASSATKMIALADLERHPNLTGLALPELAF